MASTEVKWSATLPCDPFAPIATGHATLLAGFWAEVDSEGQDTARAVAENYFHNADLWAEWWGDDAQSAMVRLIITEPAAPAGTYQVELVRTVKAVARRITADQQGGAQTSL